MPLLSPRMYLLSLSSLAIAIRATLESARYSLTLSSSRISQSSDEIVAITSEDDACV